MELDIAIVGAGHNGLVAAVYLARAGLKVHLFERRPFVGGAAITEELWPGFQFMTCAHAIWAMQPKIIRDLRLSERGLEIIPRPFTGVHLRPDGNYWGSKDHKSPRNLIANLTAEESEAADRYDAFKETLEGIFAPYRLRPPPTLEEVRSKVAGTPAAEVLEKALSTRIQDLQDEFLPTDVLRDRLADDWAPIGRNPLALTLGYFSLRAPEEGSGEAPPGGNLKGGTGVLSRMLADIAEEAGAEIHLDRAVERFLIEDGKAIGIQLADGTEIRSRAVVSNLDPKRTLLKMVATEHLDGRFRGCIEGLVTQVSCYKLLAVISELPRWKGWDGDPDLPSTGDVRLGVSRAEARAAYADLEAGRPPKAPLISFMVPSVLDPSLTQPGYHTASVWIYPVPGKLSESTWDDVREEVAERLIDQITGFAPNFRESVRHYRLRTPLDLEREVGLTDGCIWHIQHGGEQLFWNRPLPELAAYRAPFKGFYLCGAGQHPGGEVSGVPGHNAAHEILKDLDRL